MKTIFIKRLKVEGKNRIKLQFKFDPELINEIKKLPDIKWDHDHEYWHIPDMEHPITYLRKSFNSRYRIYYQDGAKTLSTTNNLVYYQEVVPEDRIHIKCKSSA